MVSDHNYTISKNSRPHSIYCTVCSVLVFRELTAVASSHAGHRVCLLRSARTDGAGGGSVLWREHGFYECQWEDRRTHGPSEWWMCRGSLTLSSVIISALNLLIWITAVSAVTPAPHGFILMWRYTRPRSANNKTRDEKRERQSRGREEEMTKTSNRDERRRKINSSWQAWKEIKDGEPEKRNSEPHKTGTYTQMLINTKYAGYVTYT